MKNVNTLDKFKSNKDVTRVEILYAFCEVKKQASSHCFSELADCFPIIFFDSKIAKKFRMPRDKLAYAIN